MRLRFIAGLVAAAACGTADAPPPEAVWLPDTATVIYTSLVDGDRDILLRRGSSGEPRNLTARAGQDHWPRVSPDGTWLLYQAIIEGNREILRMPLDGSDTPENLTRDPADDVLPEWSPDGTRIIFFSTRGMERGPRGEFLGHLYAMDADGTDVTRLTRERLTSSFGGTFSPDGSSIVFARAVDGDVEVHVMDADGANERRLTHRTGSDYGARFSPDGARIAFHSDSAGQARIMVMDRDGGNVRAVTYGGLHYDPVWSPDGRWLLFTGAPARDSVYGLLFASVEGGTAEALAPARVDERAGAWLAPR